MKIGLVDVDGHNYPNIPLMKISAWHKAQGDHVEWYHPMFSGHMDKVYLSKVFSFTPDYTAPIYADEVARGGSGYCIELENGKEVYKRERDTLLPPEIEHIYPDYSLYPEKTRNTAYGFLTRGCPRNCEFCHVAAKEGKCSIKVADLAEFWMGQEKIVICDPNILACRDWEDLLDQLISSRALVDFNQGLDVRLATPEKIAMLNRIRMKYVHLAWDRPEDDLESDFERFARLYKRKSPVYKEVYVLVNCKRKAVFKVDRDGREVEVYRSAREAAKANHMSYQTVLDRCNGKVKDPYALDGFTYRFEDAGPGRKKTVTE